VIKVGIAGAAGKMGRALVRAVTDHNALTLAAAWESKGHACLGQDAGQLAGIGALKVELSDAVAGDIKACEVIIDFTAPEATIAITREAVSAGRALVIGTTGLSDKQIAMIRKAGEQIPIVYATNFSTGVNLLWALARQAARILGEAYDVEIIESHHNMKKDAPSGTALTLLEAVCQGRGLDPKQVARYGRQGMVGARQKQEIGVHAVRAGDIVGEHSALFAGTGERLELKHQAHSRDTFARGAARAAAWVTTQPAGFYHMSDVLGLKSM